MNINFELAGGDSVAAALRKLSDLIPETVEPVVIKYGRMLETEVKRNASGRPGPNAPTGNYRRSWTTRIGKAAHGTSATVGTNAPQARRLEYGFHGTDALGRTYNQPPYPHAGPAWDKVTPEFVDAVVDALRGMTL